MTTTALKKIATAGGDFSTLQSWEDAAPLDHTLTRTGFATQAGSIASTIVLDAGASAVDGFYVGHAVWVDARSSEKRLITAYVGATQTATISALNFGETAIWDNIPASGENYTIDSTIWQGGIHGTITVAAGLGVTIATGTTIATNYNELIAYPGTGFRDSANALTPLRGNLSNGSGIAYGGNYNTCIVDQQGFTRIRNLQIICSAFNGAAYAQTTILTNTVDSCILEYKITRGFKNFGGVTSNCLIVGTNAQVDLVDCSFGGGYFNCTLVAPVNTGPVGNALRGNYGTLTVRNCAIFNCSNVTTGSNTFNFTTCFSNAASLPSGVTRANLDGDLFVNPFTNGSHDYRIPYTSALRDTGTTDTTYASIGIIGTARPQGAAYDVGCWELITPASPTIRERANLFPKTIMRKLA